MTVMPDPAPLGRLGLAVLVGGYLYGLMLLGLGVVAVVVVVRALMALGGLVGMGAGW